MFSTGSSLEVVARAALLFAVVASFVAALDLLHKELALAERGAVVSAHSRPATYVVGIALVSSPWAAAILLTRSTSIALSGGVLLGGAVGNLLSLALWPSVAGIPNPLVFRVLAFNLADLAAMVGFALLLASTVAFAARNRQRLREPVRLRA
jgi:lipoprotein signal peptidase